MKTQGQCYGLGVGPGDPELLTLKALRILQSCQVVASFAAPGKEGVARHTVEGLLKPDQADLRFVYPTTAPDGHPGGYEALLARFYDATAEQLADILDQGNDVAVLCEGDPFLHGSFMYIHRRMTARYATHVVPGVPALLAASAAIGAPLVCRDETLVVATGLLDRGALAARLTGADAAVVMKVGRHLDRVRGALADAGLLERAWYIERATSDEERIVPLSELTDEVAPYFSCIVVPSISAPGR